jgi:hypothetical protein
MDPLHFKENVEDIDPWVVWYTQILINSAKKRFLRASEYSRGCLS